MYDSQGALLLTEVLKEREAQIELKKLKEEGLIGQDRGHLEKLRRDFEEAKRIDSEEKMRVREEKLKTAEFQRAQWVEFYGNLYLGVVRISVNV